MAMWSDVELLTNEDTGTVRLGSVSTEENGSGLYQVDTLAKISAASEVQGEPHLSSSSGSNWSIVVADKTVILSDQTYQTILLLLHFETRVEAFDVCLNGQFLVVCEQNGNLHLIYVPHKKILLTKALVENKPTGAKTYHYLIMKEDQVSSGTYHVFLLIKDSFFHITNLALAKMETAIAKMDLGVLKELQSVIKIDIYPTSKYHNEGCSTAVLFTVGQEIHLLIGGDQENVLTDWKMDTNGKMCLAHRVSNTLIPGVQKMVVVNNLVYILDTEDFLSLWDVNVFVMIHCWSDLFIHDFELTSECGSAAMSQDGSSIKMITIVKQGNSQINLLQIRSLPSMTVCYSMNISSVSCLVHTNINMDTFYLVEGIFENPESRGQPISSLAIRCFTEALPENRLSRLLYKHMFEEAEKFAIAFELDLELVYKVKLDFVLEQLASASVGGYGQEVWSDLVEEARTNLMKISDEQYVVEYCLKAPWPTFEMAEKMLNHAASHYCTLQIQEALARLATFCSLYTVDKFNGIAWIEFLNCTDVFGDILCHLRDADLKGAQLLWLRHEGQMAAEFDEQKLEEMLNSIPEDLPSKDLCPWFNSVFFPFVRRVLPSGQKNLAKWLEQRARNLELTEKSAWPQNGLNLAVLGLPSLWTWTKCDDNYGAEEVENLKSLVTNLGQLLELDRKYNCKLSLSVFEKGNARSVAFFMLDKVPAPELISHTVETCIVPYAQEQNLSYEELLLQYIKDLLERCSSQTTTLFTEWEAKAVAVLGCMTDSDLMVDAVLEIMQKAVVPWNNIVEKLVQQYLEMEGPKQELLKENYRLMEIRKLLRGYGIRNFNLTNNNQIMTVIRHILKQNLPCSLKDSLTLAEAYKLPTAHISYLHLIQLIRRGKREECMTVLKRMSTAEAECVIQRLTTWARLQLEDKEHLSEEHKKEQMSVAQVMVEALKYLQIIQKNDGLKSMECEKNLVMFHAISNLQEDFDIFFTPTNYEDPQIRKQIQEHHITAYENTRGHCSSKAKPQRTPVMANDPDGKTKTISTEAGLRRLGRQLQRTEQELWSDLAHRALGVGKVDKALKILSELYEHHCNTSTGRVLFTAAKTLCQMLEADVPMVLCEGMDLPAVIHNLACQATTVCHSDLLLDCLELCKCTRIAMDVYHQCQLSDNYGFIGKDVTEAEKDPNYQDVFNEDCIVLDPVSVLPVQYEITNCLLPISYDAILYPLDCSCLSHCSFEDGSNYLPLLLNPLSNMLQMLQECSQLELALRVLVNLYGSSLQHCTSNVMDLRLGVQLYDKNTLKKYNMCLSELWKITISSMNAVVLALLNKVFNWRMVDCNLAIGLCTLLSESEVFKILWKVIDNAWQNYDKILAVAKVGANLCCLYARAEEKIRFLSVITDAEWGIKLSKLEISMQPVFRQQDKSQLTPVLVKNSQITSDIILQYCSTYDLAQDSVINQYITTLLLLQEDVEGVGSSGTDQRVDSRQEQDQALERVLQIIPKLHSTSELTDNLCAAVFKLSPYNYERIEVVLKILEVADENVPSFSVCQAMALLKHLKSYKRVSAPSNTENTYLLENNLLPNQLSNTRLPFHLLMQTKHFWKIISPELTEETFPTLLLISKLMKVCLDKLYMSAANHVFEEKMKPLLLEQKRRGNCHGYNKETLKVAKIMMRYIHCIQSPEWAAATAHKIAQELPPGYEKTQSLRFCLALGETWLKDPNLEAPAQSRGETFLSKLKLQYQRSATENTLIANHLSSPELLKLSGLPAKLIVSLYEHSSVEQRYRDTACQSYPDLHAVIKEVAAINSVDLLKICNMLLEKWICKTGPAVAKEMSAGDCVSIEDDPDLMRVVYMLQSCPMEKSLHLLTPVLSAETWPLSSSGPRLTFCHRTRALLCLVRLTDAQTLEMHTYIPRGQIQFYLKSYVFVSQLEALNIPYTLQSFLSSPKDGLVKGLWKNHSHEPRAVQLVTDLCLEYQIYDPQLWNSLLQKLLGFNLIGHLQKILDALVAVPSLWEISSFSRTWRSTILAPFVSASFPLTPEQQIILYRTFVLLLKCPFVLSLDLIGIANRFAQLQLSAFALGTLLLIPYAQKKAQQIQGFLSLCNPLTVLEQVEELMSTGELAGIPSKIRDTVLSFISQSGQQQKLIKTRHFAHLRHLILSHGHTQEVRQLVKCLVNHNCPEEAASLARDFLKHRDPHRAKLVTNGSASPGSCIKEFLSLDSGLP
ncbi:kinetochore-associated protein 1 [Periophthalmus magnuspinnatus]|uniref:kinetochore-associated protein 1 n=1 Tax=Periophthalmus magnuspinnatus TaxID=409849 RepID=UPI00145A8351|nr:kinetochore-associated protein 1 [Periophthalmus magnuspinnatus]